MVRMQRDWTWCPGPDKSKGFGEKGDSGHMQGGVRREDGGGRREEQGGGQSKEKRKPGWWLGGNTGQAGRAGGH